MADKKETADVPQVSPPAGVPKLLTLLVGANILFTLGIVGVLLVIFQKEAHKAEVSDIVAAEPQSGKKQEGEVAGGGEPGKADTAVSEEEMTRAFGKMIALEQFTVNLSSLGSISPKFARVDVAVEVPNEDTENEIQQKMPQVRNTIIDLFNSKRPSDLSTVEGRNFLKEEIKNSLNSFLVRGKVKGVYFTSFAISS